MKNKNTLPKKYPLIKNNISRQDLDNVIDYLKLDDPKLTNGPKVKEFEKAWSKWLGVKYSIFVNSGSSANLISMSILKKLFPNGGNVIVPAFTWSSDIASIIQNGFEPKFVDININSLGIDAKKTIDTIDENTRAVFITHAQGFNALSHEIINFLNDNNIKLIEDVCEAHGATFENNKCGTYGWMSNFSFYYAHHMSTIEGGMVCTNDESIYQQARMLRSHGLLRENSNESFINSEIKKNPELNPEFIFMFPAYNLRNNEINAIIGLNQLKRLDYNIKKRNENQDLFYHLLDCNKYKKDFYFEGSSNYAFNIVLKNNDDLLMKKLRNTLNKNNIEFRQGSAGGGNQLRQPYLNDYKHKIDFKFFKNTDHMHFYSLYIGNYPDLKKIDIKFIVETVNAA